MGQCVPFIISVWADGEPCQTVVYCQGENVLPIMRRNTLCTPSMPRFFIHCVLEVFKLHRSMDGRPFSIQCILMKDGNDWSSVGLYHPTHGTNADITKLVIVNALDVNRPEGTVNDPDIGTGNSSISPTVNKGFVDLVVTPRNNVHKAMFKG